MSEYLELADWERELLADAADFEREHMSFKVDDFKINDEVSIGDSEGLYTVKGFTDTHVWVESAHEVKEGYSNPYYTVKRSEITLKPELVWEVGHTYEAWPRAAKITVTAVDEDGNALVKWRYTDKSEFVINFKLARARKIYTEVK